MLLFYQFPPSLVRAGRKLSNAQPPLSFSLFLNAEFLATASVASSAPFSIQCHRLPNGASWLALSQRRTGSPRSNSHQASIIGFAVRSRWSIDLFVAIFPPVVDLLDYKLVSRKIHAAYGQPRTFFHEFPPISVSFSFLDATLNLVSHWKKEGGRRFSGKSCDSFFGKGDLALFSFILSHY